MKLPIFQCLLRMEDSIRMLQFDITIISPGIRRRISLRQFLSAREWSLVLSRAHNLVSSRLVSPKKAWSEIVSKKQDYEHETRDCEHETRDCEHEKRDCEQITMLITWETRLWAGDTRLWARDEIVSKITINCSQSCFSCSQSRLVLTIYCSQSRLVSSRQSVRRDCEHKTRRDCEIIRLHSSAPNCWSEIPLRIPGDSTDDRGKGTRRFRIGRLRFCHTVCGVICIQGIVCLVVNLLVFQVGRRRWLTTCPNPKPQTPNPKPLFHIKNIYLF